MKKNVIYLLAVAVAAIACAKETDIETLDKANESGRTIFSGTCINTKIALGDKTGDTYPAIWETGDAIDVYNASDNSLIGTASLDAASAGQQNGQFILNQTIADGTSVKLVYPSGDGFAVPAEQAKESADDSSLITKAESDAVTVQDGQAAFTLSHQSAIIKVDVTSSAFAGKLLKSVTLYAQGATLSDESGDDAQYTRVTYSTPTAISAGGTVSAVFAARPISTAADFYVAVKLVNPADELDMVCIPKKFTGKTLNPGKVTRIDCTSLSETDNAVAWYNPYCKRYIPSGGWCYGSSTTILVMNTKNSYSDFDVRACGEFIDVIRYAKEPKYFYFRCGDTVDTGNPGVWKIESDTPAKKAYVAIASYSPRITLAKAFSELKNGKDKQASLGLVNLCDANKNIIGAYLLWAAAPGETTYDSGTVMNMNLGGSAANGNAAEQRGALYQWGRPYPFGYPNDYNTTYTDVRITSYALSASHADGLGLIGSENENKDWWQDGTHKYDLWGNTETSETSTAGVKTIFDPCPQGWRVAPPAVLKEVYENATYDDVNAYRYRGDAYSVTYFRNGETGARGSAKGLYWANNAANDIHGWHFEFNADNSSFSGTWRSNACAVRCVKDADNR